MLPVTPAPDLEIDLEAAEAILLAQPRPPEGAPAGGRRKAPALPEICADAGVSFFTSSSEEDEDNESEAEDEGRRRSNRLTLRQQKLRSQGASSRLLSVDDRNHVPNVRGRRSAVRASAFRGSCISVSRASRVSFAAPALADTVIIGRNAKPRSSARRVAAPPVDETPPTERCEGQPREASPYAYCAMSCGHGACLRGGEQQQPAGASDHGSPEPASLTGLDFNFQSPALYKPLPIDSETGELASNGTAHFFRLLYHSMYELRADVRWPRVLLALIFKNLFDCSLALYVMPYIIDDVVPNMYTGDTPNYEPLYWVILGFTLCYPPYLCAVQLIVSKPLDQVYLRVRLFRHALRLPWAFFNGEGTGATDEDASMSAGGGQTSHEVLFLRLVNEDADTVMDATCSAFELFETLVHMLVIIGVILSKAAGREFFGPITLHLFTFIVIHTFFPRVQNACILRQRHRDTYTKEAHEALRSVGMLQLFHGEGYAAQRMFKGVKRFDRHHFAAVKLQFQIEQLPDIIGKILWVATLVSGAMLVGDPSVPAWTTGTLVGLLWALDLIKGDVTQAVRHVMTFGRAGPSLVRVYNFLHQAEREIADDAAAVTVKEKAATPAQEAAAAATASSVRRSGAATRVAVQSLV